MTLTLRQRQFAADTVAKVAKRNGIHPLAIVSKCRRQDISRARWEAFTELYASGYSQGEIALVFQHEDGTPMHVSTVTHGIRKLKTLRSLPIDTH